MTDENWIVGTNDRAIEAARKRLPEAHLLRLCADRQGTCEHGHDGALRCVMCCLEIAGAEVNRLAAENARLEAAATRDLRVRQQQWAVSVARGGENILTIESNCLSGRDLSDEDTECIRACARHLLSFVGEHA